MTMRTVWAVSVMIGEGTFGMLHRLSQTGGYTEFMYMYVLYLVVSQDEVTDP
jgi:hypothetical protein